MAGSAHFVIIVGNLGGDPTMRYTGTGKAVTNFSVATTRRFTKADGTVADETVWFRASTWGKTAELCNARLKKGAKVLILGRITPGEGGSPRIFEKADGTPAASYEINCSEVHFLSTRDDGQEVTESMSEGEEENIPF